jgi:hypothetical protein
VVAGVVSWLMQVRLFGNGGVLYDVCSQKKNCGAMSPGTVTS